LHISNIFITFVARNGLKCITVLLRYMKYSELIRLLKQNGWIVVSQKGSHLKMRHPKHENSLIVPNHGAKEAGTGITQAILKQGKIT